MRKFTMILALLFFAGLQGVLAQTRVITGVVISSEDNVPIPGVTVLVKGTTLGTTTDLEGKYALSVPTKYNVIVFSYVGMKTQEITLGESNTINLTMNPDILNMDEVVVTAIGIPRETKALSYSVQEVGGDDISKSGQVDFIGALQGKVADVQIISSAGTAGASSYISIRGVQSLTQSNAPLFVVDGVPISNSGGDYGVDGVATSNRAIDINPDDIASINVLKGGAATALYGLRAASGAIIITTKKGKATTGKKISVNFNTSITFDQVSQLPKLQKQFAQGTGGPDGLEGQWVSGYSATWGPLMDTCSYYVDPNFKWRTFDVDGQIVSKHDSLANGLSVNSYDPYDIFQTGVTTNNSISLVGGSEVANFYFSFSNNQSKGIIPNNTFRRNTFKLSGETMITDKFKIAGNANYMITAGDRIQQGSNTSGLMLGLLRTPPSFNNNAGYIIGIDDPSGRPAGSQRNYRRGSGYDNPYWTTEMNKYADRTNRLIGNIQADWYATKWLSFTYRVGVDWWDRKVNDELAVNSRTYPAGWIKETMEVNKDFNSDLIMIIEKELFTDFDLKFLLGNNMSQLYFHSQTTDGWGLVIPDYYNLNNAVTQNSYESTVKIRRAAFYGDLSLSWKSMLYLSVTGRNDWSTTLPAGKNSFFYPSVGGGFIFTELPFLKDNKILPYGKLRASYAIVAKDAPPYATATYFGTPYVADGWTTGLTTWPLMGYPGFAWGTSAETLGNSELKPEKTKNFEIGADLKFLNNRIGLSYTYFSNKGEDLILLVPIAASTGSLNMWQNAGAMRTRGNEVTLDVIPIKSKNWEWDIQVNFAKLNNEVLALAPGIENLFLGGFTDPQIRAVVGEPYRTIYGYDWIYDANGNLLINDVGSPDPTSPDYNRYYGYPMMGNDMVPLGNVDPNWTMGIGSTLRWKDLSFYFLLDIKDGGEMWNGTRGAIVHFGTSFTTNTRDIPYLYEGVYGHLDNDGNIVSTGIPNTTTYVGMGEWWRQREGGGFNGPSSPFIEKSNWVRLRSITLSYSLTKLLKNTFIKGLDIYFTGTNLWLSTPYTGVDPETSLLGNSNAQGIDYFNMPGTKSYTLGLNVAF
ncbi:MAG: SusC/RagA family TonB-linked outer membrane protein [bacterium]